PRRTDHRGTEGRGFYLPGGVHVRQGDGQFFRLWPMGELPEPPAQPLTFAIRHYAQLRGELHLCYALRPGIRQTAEALNARLGPQRRYALFRWSAGIAQTGRGL